MFTLNQPVDSVQLTASKANGNAGNVTMQLFEMSYCIHLDTDNDGTPNHLDLESDGDNCNDVLEAGFTDQNGDGVLGDAPVVVNATGEVTGTDVMDGYSGTTAAVTNMNDSTACIMDTDGDGVEDPDEVTDGTNPNDPCDLIVANQLVAPSAAWLADDCDGDGVPNGTEVTDMTDPLDECDYTPGSITLTVTSTSDCDGDGVPNNTEATDGTDPLDDCSFLNASISLAVTSTTDCDGDGVPNNVEATDGTDPQDNCSFVLASASVAPSAAWNAADCDGDGVTNGTEVYRYDRPLRRMLLHTRKCYVSRYFNFRL